MNKIIVLLLMFLATPALAVNLRELNQQIDNVVKQINGNDADAVEIRKARKIYFIDADGDGVRDAIVFILIEGMMGGNNYEQYLILLKGKPYHFTLLDTALIGGGGLGAASDNRPSIRDGLITILRTEYAEEDSRCCPSIKSSVTLTLKDGKLAGGAKREQ